MIRFESLIRLTDPASTRVAEQIRILASSTRQRLAKIVLDTALEIGEDPRAGLVEKVVAWQAAHRVRADLLDRAQLTGVQRQLVRGLEELNDPAAAHQVAETALAEYPTNHPGEQRTPEHDSLSGAVLRLARGRSVTRNDQPIEATIAAAAAGGAAIGLEARIWAVIDLLSQPGQRQRALELTDQVAAELSRRNDLGAVGKQWRLLLAFHAGRAGYRTIAQQLLAPMLSASNQPEDEHAARGVLFAVDGPGADIRLQIVGLKAELQTLPPDAESELLRLHRALAADYDVLGDYRQALHHGQQELALRRRLRGTQHPDTLSARSQIAFWTGRCGHPEDALRLFKELLSDQEQVLGPDHPDTLGTRSSIAAWTGEAGDPAKALQLSKDLLPDQQRILGTDHPRTLSTRGNIASWTGRCEDPEGALRLHQELLADDERILGPDHPDTLRTRNNIAYWTGQCGRPAEALQLGEKLLHDLKRILGPEHPFTLRTRSNIAIWTEAYGHPEDALRLHQDLLPDQERLLGPDHPDTLFTQRAITRLSPHQPG